MFDCPIRHPKVLFVDVQLKRLRFIPYFLKITRRKYNIVFLYYLEEPLYIIVNKSNIRVDKVIRVYNVYIICV